TTPTHTAVVSGSETLTYRQLNERANQLAHSLIQRGTGTETLVGIALERSHEFAVAVLAVLKAGAACLPLDPAYPAEWLAFVVNDARPALVITDEHLRVRLPQSVQWVAVDDRSNGRGWEADSNPSAEHGASSMKSSHPAYVIY